MKSRASFVIQLKFLQSKYELVIYARSANILSKAKQGFKYKNQHPHITHGGLFILYKTFFIITGSVKANPITRECKVRPKLTINA